MLTKDQTNAFIENSHHAIDYIFQARSEYHRVRSAAQATIEEIDEAKQMLSDLFMYREQWSPHANHHYAQYMERLRALNEMRNKPVDVRVEDALASIGATTESMSHLAGTVLQIAKQVLSLRYSAKPSIPGARRIGTQSIVEILWEGRNHAMHWDEGAPKQRVQDMLDTLTRDLGIAIEAGKNNCLSIMGALGWKSTDNVISDLKALVN